MAMATGTEAAADATPAPSRKGRPRRRWWIAGAVVAVLAVLFYGGGGWYFASQIRSDALLVEPDDPPDFEIEVYGADAGTITFLLGDDPEEDLLSDEYLGVLRPTGTARPAGR